MKIGLYYIPRSLDVVNEKYLACSWNYNTIEIYLPFHRERNHGHDGDIRDKLAKD